MKQRKRTSLIESVLNILIGCVIAFIGQLIVFPMVGIHGVSLGTNALITVAFTGISVVRSYLIRRLFEYLRVSGIMP